MTHWQPIETAPRDGTAVLIYPAWRIAWWEFGDDRWMFDAVPIDWGDNHRPYVAKDGRSKGFLCRYVDRDKATHWMSLPEPPKD